MDLDCFSGSNIEGVAPTSRIDEINLESYLTQQITTAARTTNPEFHGRPALFVSHDNIASFPLQLPIQQNDEFHYSHKETAIAGNNLKSLMPTYSMERCNTDNTAIIHNIPESIMVDCTQLNVSSALAMPSSHQSGFPSHGRRSHLTSNVVTRKRKHANQHKSQKMGQKCMPKDSPRSEVSLVLTLPAYFCQVQEKVNLIISRLSEVTSMSQSL